jgi:hypothetical protein
MNVWQQALWCVELAIYKRRVEDQLCRVIGGLRLPPVFDLALQGLEISLDAVHTNCQGVDEIKALAVLGQDRRERALDKVPKFWWRERRADSCNHLEVWKGHSAHNRIQVSHLQFQQRFRFMCGIGVALR